MKKYIIMFLMSFLLQDNIQCVDYKADLNKAIQPQLISARKVIGNVKLSLDLDVILDASVSYAKRGNDQSIEAINKMKDIETALQKYRSDQYTFWINTTIFFGYDHPKLVTDSIDPAIKRVQNALKTLQANATSLGYVVAASVAGAAILGIAAWFASQPKTDPLDAALLKDMDKIVGNFTVETVAFRWASVVAEAICKEASISPSSEKDYKSVNSAAYDKAIVGLSHAQADDTLNHYNPASGDYNANEASELKKAVIFAARDCAGKIEFKMLTNPSMGNNTLSGSSNWDFNGSPDLKI